MAFDENGLVPDRDPQIMERIQEVQIATIPETTSYQNSNTVYQLNSVYSRSLDQVSQLVEAAFDTLKLGSAEGYHLEEIARLRNVFRISAQPSNTNSQWAILQPGAVIPAGSLFGSTSLTGVQATNAAPVTGITSSCNEAEALTGTIVTGVTYGWSINGNNYGYLTTGGESITDVHDALVLLLDADGTKTFTYTEQSSSGSRSFNFIADTGTTLSITPLTIRISVIKVKVSFYVETIGTGPIAVSAGQMDTLQNPVVGFFETANGEDFILGREQESDSDLRVRVQAGPIFNNSGTPDTIKQALLTNVSGVTYVDIIENLDYATGFPTDADGRPWLSYETLVLGGSDEEVAQEIWRTRPATAWTYGNIANEPVVDSSGLTKFVSFSRPTVVNINVVLTHDQSLSETDFPLGGNTAIETAIVNYISSLPIGQNVVANRLIGIAYAAIGGRGTIITSVQIEDDASPGLTDFIAIGATEYALADASSVTVTDVTPP